MNAPVTSVAGIDVRTPTAPLTTASRAHLLFQHVRSAANEQLWQAAMGSDAAPGAQDTGTRPADAPDFSGLSELLERVVPDAFPARPIPQPPRTPSGDGPSDAHAHRSEGPAMRTGSSRPFGELIAAAATRTGIPPEALSALIDAEAAKDVNGEWLPYSRNPRSTAAGLGQFLSRTWLGEAQRSGTTLNAIAHAQGWLTDSGRIADSSRSAALAMRYDPRTSIDAIADLATSNIAAMRKAGLTLGDTPRDLAKLIYLTHHLGTSDSIRFLTGRLDPDRAAKLLAAQIGSAAADRRISQAGNSVTAHQRWLLSYLAENIRPERFAVAGRQRTS